MLSLSPTLSLLPGLNLWVAGDEHRLIIDALINGTSQQIEESLARIGANSKYASLDPTQSYVVDFRDTDPEPQFLELEQYIAIVFPSDGNTHTASFYWKKLKAPHKVVSIQLTGKVR